MADATSSTTPARRFSRSTSCHVDVVDPLPAVLQKSAKLPQASFLHSLRRATGPGLPDPSGSFSICRTIALPTTTPSAIFATAPAWSGVEIPNPAASGNFVTLRILSISGASESGQRRLFAGDSGPRNKIHETGGILRDQFQAALGGSRGGEKNGIELGRAHGRDVGLGFFDADVGEQAAVDTRRLSRRARASRARSAAPDSNT